MAKTLDDYLKEITTLAAGRDLSAKWYRDKVKEVVPMRGQRIAMSENQMIRSIRQGRVNTTKPTYGIMNLYFYSPKHEQTLPYYDVFPLVIPIKRYKDGFLGVNFHYLSVPLRLKLLEKLRVRTAEGRIVGWSRVARIKQIKPCVKRYLTSHVGSRYLKISDEEMEVAAMLPVQKFKKATARQVWAESRRMVM